MAAHVQCTIPNCDKSYTRTSSLRRHIDEAHNENPRLPCEQCEKTFTRSEFLKRHMGTHHVEGKDFCTICSRSFQSNYLAAHRDACLDKAKIRCAQQTGAADSGGSPAVMLSKCQQHHGNSAVRALTNPDKTLLPASEASQYRPPTYSRQKLDMRVLVEEAKAAVKDGGSETLTDFLSRLQAVGVTLSDVETSSREITPDERYIPLIVLAAKHSTLGTISTLKDYGLDLSSMDGLGMTALHQARNAGMLNALLKAGADPSFSGSNNWLPLCSAISQGETQQVSILLYAGARLDPIPIESEDSPIGLVVRCQDHAMFKLLLTPSLGQGMGQAIFSEALKHGTASMVELVLQQGAQDFDEQFTVHPDDRQHLLSKALDVGSEPRSKPQANLQYPEAEAKLRLLGLQEELAQLRQRTSDPMTDYRNNSMSFCEQQVADKDSAAARASAMLMTPQDEALNDLFSFDI